MFAMRDPSAPRVDTSRIHRLLRALVGVADVSIIVTPEGKLRSVAVLRDGNVQEHQLVRNVVSGLKAGFGLRLDANDVQVILHADAWRQRAAAEAERRAAADTAPSLPAPALPAPSLPAPPAVTRPHISGAGPTNGNGIHINGKRNGHGRANGNGATRQNGNGSVSGNWRVQPAPVRFTPLESQATSSRPVTEPRRTSSSDNEPRLEAIDVERQGATLRCRASVGVGSRTFSAIAEVRDAPTAEAELAARVTLDALRAGGLTTARLEGVSLTTLADVVYVVAAVRSAASAAPRASAAPLVSNMASAAAVAVLRAHGPVGIVEPRAALNGTI
jgi:hypothetical protein